MLGRLVWIQIVDPWFLDPWINWEFIFRVVSTRIWIAFFSYHKRLVQYGFVIFA